MQTFRKEKIIKGFVHKMKIFNNKLDLNALKKKHFFYLKDHSYVSQDDRGGTMLYFSLLVIYNIFFKVISKIDIFTPQSIPVVLWNLNMFIVLLSQVFAIPLKISYGLSFEDDPYINTFLI